MSSTDERPAEGKGVMQARVAARLAQIAEELPGEAGQIAGAAGEKVAEGAKETESGFATGTEVVEKLIKSLSGEKSLEK